MEENELKLAQMEAVIAKTEKKLKKYFQNDDKILNDQYSGEPISYNKSPCFDKTQKTCASIVKIKSCTSKNTTRINSQKKHESSVLNLNNKPSQKNNVNKKEKENKTINYEMTMRRLDLRKVRILDQLNKMDDKHIPKSPNQEKKLKYEISVLKAEILHEKETKKKLFAELEKYKNRYKLNNFYPENLKII